MIIIGLTGSIGMGKTTTAKLFAEEGVPVADSDAIVHALYSGAAAPLIEALFPGTVVDGVVDRIKLSTFVIGKPENMKRLEALIHPLVRQAQDEFLAKAKANSEKIALLDIPLLFETKAENRVDKIVVVSAPADVQKARVLARPGMTAEKFEAILARQTPDAQKRERADFVIDTSKGLDTARQDVRSILDSLSKTL
ncbi:MAG: dephospho-CoA kinase [Notoacmeibacter sp.]